MAPNSPMSHPNTTYPPELFVSDVPERLRRCSQPVTRRARTPLRNRKEQYGG